MAESKLEKLLKDNTKAGLVWLGLSYALMGLRLELVPSR
jgi:hypothetical protein